MKAREPKPQDVKRDAALKRARPAIRLPRGWTVCVGDQGLKEVIPRNDLMHHLGGMFCFCRPTLTEGVIVHNAVDMRH